MFANTNLWSVQFVSQAFSEILPQITHANNRYKYTHPNNIKQSYNTCRVHFINNYLLTDTDNTITWFIILLFSHMTEPYHGDSVFCYQKWINWKSACFVKWTFDVLAEKIIESWWRHQMETFFALLTLWVGNSPVTGEFPSQRPGTWSFDIFFDLRLNKRLNKQSRGWWFDTPSRSLIMTSL